MSWVGTTPQDRRGLAGFARSARPGWQKVVVLGPLLPVWASSEIRQTGWQTGAKAGAIGAVWLLTAAAVASGSLSSPRPSPTAVAQADPTPGATLTAKPTPEPTPEPTASPEPFRTSGGAVMPGPPDGATPARVVRVTDGDTVVLQGIDTGELDAGTGGRKTRLIGIDTPEVFGGEECYGAEASAFTKRELDGRDVLVDFDVERTDRYGRALAYVWTTDGAFFNGRLAAEGYANQATFPPNVRYAELFTALVAEARDNNRGLWSGCPAAAVPPPAPQPKPKAQPQAGGALGFGAFRCDADGNDHDNLNDEWIEIVNGGGSSVQLGGYRVSDLANHVYTFKSGFTLGAGATVQLFTGSGTDSQTAVYWGSGRAVWNNDGDTATLSDTQGNAVAQNSC